MCGRSSQGSMATCRRCSCKACSRASSSRSSKRLSSAARAAIVAPSVLYAALHFLGGKLRVPPEEVSWVHGFQVLSRLFERYAQPLAFVDSFLALVTLGILLALVRLRTGA